MIIWNRDLDLSYRKLDTSHRLVFFKLYFAYYEPSLRYFLEKHKPFYFSLKSISLMMCNSMESTFYHWDTTRSQQNFDFMKCVVEFLFAFHGTSVSVTIDHVYFKLNHYFIFFYLLDFFVELVLFVHLDCRQTFIQLLPKRAMQTEHKHEEKCSRIERNNKNVKIKETKRLSTERKKAEACRE